MLPCSFPAASTSKVCAWEVSANQRGWAELPETHLDMDIAVLVLRL